MLAQGVGLLDVTLIVLYLASIAYLGWLGYRHTKTAADYLIAGRKVHPFIMAMSYGSTFISTSAIVGFGGVAAMFGMSLLWLTVCNIFVGIFIAFVFLGGPTRHMGHRLDAHTFPELLGRRYESKFIHVLAGLIIFVVMPLYASAVMIGGTEFMATAFNINYPLALLIFAVVTAAYVFWGGLKGVLYTDALQGSIMVLGMVFLIVYAYYTAGGVTEGHTALGAMSDKVGPFKAIGHQGWTAMPLFGWGKPDGLAAAAPSPYNLWWIVVGTIVMGVGIGVLAQPQLVVRFMTVKSKRELNRALAIGGLFILLMTGVAFTAGALSNVYFSKYEVVRGKMHTPPEQVNLILKDDPGRPPVAMPVILLHLDTLGDGYADTHIIQTGVGPALGKVPTAEVKDLGDGRVEVRPNATAYMRSVVWDAQKHRWMLNSDSIIPAFVTSAMPRWFKIIFLLTLLSAAMSTMSSQYHALGSAIGRDVFDQLAGNRGDATQKTIHVVRIGIIVGLIVAITISYFSRGGYFIARATSIWFGLCASAFLPTFVGGLFTQRITKAAAIASMSVGFLVTAFWLMFVKEAEAGAIGLVRYFTPDIGNGIHPNSILYNYPNWPVVDPMFVALPLSILTAIVVSLVTRPPTKEHLARCFGRGDVATVEEKAAVPTGR
jgi:SSS family solute:Na+ symporter